MVMALFGRRRPTAAELTVYSISAGDFRAAAHLIVAGALEVITELEPEHATREEKARTLELALSRVQA